MRGGVRLRSQQSLFLRAKQDEADRALGLNAGSLENPRRLEHGDRAGAVVRSAGAQVPRIEMSSDQHHFIGLLAFREFRRRYCTGPPNLA